MLCVVLLIMSAPQTLKEDCMKLPKVYEPDAYEADIYALWEKAEAFTPKGDGKSFSIVLPPPNANGNLHIGHALTLGLQDVAVRYHRLKGDRALLLPGADHAGFETQVVFEKQLAKEGKSRFDFSREELYDQIYEFVGKNRSNFETQFRRLGTGVDWSRFTFTLDDKVVRRAYATFKKMWDEGLVYRGVRLVNYCTFHGTAFADIEVEHKEEQGSLWHIRYELTDGTGSVVVATTRPETLFGDTAVAVHPEDPRFAPYIGKTVKLPLTHREIPIIADDFVEREFGTGAVKITPAHDPNDYEAGKRHDLPMPSVITFEGTMASDVPEAYRGMPVSEARAAVVDALKASDALVKTEDYVHNVAHCYKCGTVIQPLLKDQWFVDMKPLAARAIEVLRTDRIVFHPTSKRDQLVTYLENLHDWNISRQIAWGIPIPAFQNVDNPDDWIYDEHVDQETLEIDGKTYRRDPDVLDTWFSSSSWPYSTLGFEESSDFDDFYPLDLMDTGGEILYPWVSRMIMLGLYVTNDIPFKSVYIHGYVMAENGAKMSKSVGNVINPIEVIDEYGSDALRMGIIASRAPAVNRGYDRRKVEDARNFCNKLWNIARYIEDKTTHHHIDTAAVSAQSDADEWMLSRLQQSCDAIALALDEYRFAEAYDILYHFVWDDFADWYIEASKAQPNLTLLAFALESILTIAHPYAPFVTETIWQTLAWQPNSLLATSSWPVVPASDPQKAAAFDAIKELVTEIRRIKKNVGVTTAALTFHAAEAIANNADLVAQLARLSSVSEAPDSTGLKLTQSALTAWLEIDAETAARYRTKLMEQLEAEQGAIERLEGRLANTSYVDHAPEHVVAQTRQQLEEAKTRRNDIAAEYDRFRA